MFFHLSVIITSLVWAHLKFQSLAAVVKMDPVIPLEGKMYYIRCILEVELVELEEVHTIPFRFNLQKKVCDVTSWLKCDNPPRRPSDGACYCNRKYIREELLVYEFYYFSLSFPDNVENLTSCGLEYYASDKREVETVNFASIPPPFTQNCSGGEMTFNWIFHPQSDNIREAMRPKKVEWSFDGSLLAEYNVENKTFVSYVPECCLAVKTRMIPMLKLRMLSNNSSGIYSINVIFHPRTSSSGKGQLDFGTVYEEKEASSIRIKRKVMDDFSFEDIALLNSSSVQDYDSYMDLEPLSVETTTLPPIPESHNTLTGSTNLTVTFPPNEGVSFKIKSFSTLSGTIMLRCSVYNIRYFGLPEVNLTMWEMSRQVATATGAYSVAYSEAIGGRQNFNFSCGFTGVALQCLEPDDQRLRRQYLEVIEYEESPSTMVADIMKIIFGLQTFLCLGLMLWLTSLMVKHVSVVIYREKRLHELAVKRREVREKKKSAAVNQDAGDQGDRSMSTRESDVESLTEE